MFITLRKFTVIFLAILQLVAPLVHAHTGEKAPDWGLHVPGLELYGAEHEAVTSQPLSHTASSDEVIVGVGVGMKDSQAASVVDLDNSFYLHQQAQAFNATIASFDINFSPQPTQFVRRLFIPSLSPRAPPAQ